MIDIVRTRADLLGNLFQDGQASNTINAQDMRDLIVSVNQFQETAAGEFSSSVTQIAGASDTAVNIALEVNIFKEHLTHSITVSNEEITFELPGVYVVDVNIQVFQAGGGGGAQIGIWMQRDNGSGFEDTTSAIRIDTTANAAGQASLAHIGRHVPGDKIRLMWSTDNVNGQLTSFAAAGPLPLIPSVVVRIFKIGD